MLHLHRPHVFGLQEAMYSQVEQLSAALDGRYSWLGVGRDDGDRGGELGPIFYDPERVALVSNWTFWLSTEPDVVGSRGWGELIAFG